VKQRILLTAFRELDKKTFRRLYWKGTFTIQVKAAFFLFVAFISWSNLSARSVLFHPESARRNFDYPGQESFKPELNATFSTFKVSTSPQEGKFCIACSPDLLQPSDWMGELLSSVIFFSVGQIQFSSLDQGPLGKKSDLLPWDRPFVGQQSLKADQISDLLIIAGVLPPLLLNYLDQKEKFSWQTKSGKESLGEGVRFAGEGRFSPYFWGDLLGLTNLLLVNSGLNLAVRSAVFQPRPWALGKEDVPAEAQHSFYSGHTSAAFAVATYYSTLIWGRHGDEELVKPASALFFSLATVVGLARVVAGKHYPSDVWTGAWLGSGLGYLYAYRRLTYTRRWKEKFSGWRGYPQIVYLPSQKGRALGIFGIRVEKDFKFD